mmetsp:Transcript_27117/g.31569  ORF Transcript_27117/g.31569 Transcript_27117/m.31569 type:complete len:222 (-) Transcript_27117:501-1166(-)
MPKFFDDYSNTYLTHDSAAGRKQQRRGWKFRENFKLHYDKHLNAWRSGEMGLASAQQAYMKANAHNPHAVPPLPDGWIEEDDGATRSKYYVNTKTQERTWVRPGFIPPAVGGPPPPGLGGGVRPPPMNMRGPPPNFIPPRGAGGPPGRGGHPPPPPRGMSMGNFPPPPVGLPPPSMAGGPPPGGFPPPPPMGSFPPPPGPFQPPPGPFQPPPPGNMRPPPS